MTTWNKGEVISDAYAEIGLVNYEYDLNPDQTTLALRKLDNIMAALELKGICYGYPMTLGPTEAELTQETNLPNYAYSYITKALGIELAPTVGKAVSRELLKAAKDAYSSLMIEAVKLPEQQMPANIPAGAGNKRYNGEVFLDPPEDTTKIGDEYYKIG
jgi:hypothetical protein